MPVANHCTCRNVYTLFSILKVYTNINSQIKYYIISSISFYFLPTWLKESLLPTWHFQEEKKNLVWGLTWKAEVKLFRSFWWIHLTTQRRGSSLRGYHVTTTNNFLNNFFSTEMSLQTQVSFYFQFLSLLTVLPQQKLISHLPFVPLFCRVFSQHSTVAGCHLSHCRGLLV